jgi:hypothetical protein
MLNYVRPNESMTLALRGPRPTVAILSLLMFSPFGTLRAEAAGSAARPIVVRDELPAANGQRYGVNYVYVLRGRARQAVLEAHIGDTVSLGVFNLGCWIESLMDTGVITRTAVYNDLKKIESTVPPDPLEVQKGWNTLATEALPALRLYMAGNVMGTLRVSEFRIDNPNWYGPETDPRYLEEVKHLAWVEFDLTREGTSQASRVDWSSVLTAAGVDKVLPVSIAMYQQNQDVAHVIASPSKAFLFQRFPSDWPTIIGIALLILAFILFLYWAFNTGIIRDPTQNVCPDGLPPFSLGRCQMAFWFFVVIATFYFLWLVTGRGDTDTINGTVLTLIGISAGTALGSAVISQNQTQVTDGQAVMLLPLAGGVAPTPLPVQIRQLRKQLREANENLQNKSGDALAAAQTDIQATLGQLSRAEAHLKQFKRNRLRQLLMDILSENEATNDPQKNTRIITFHRFQIVVWTLVLGIIFVSQVVTRLAMPTLDATLLTLMGISSGTYLGFKLPSTPTPK